MELFDLNSFEKKLAKLEKDLEQYDPNKADEDHLELKKLFFTVYDSGILDLYHLPKQKQDLLKLKLFTSLSKVSGALSFLVIQILAANSIMVKNNYHKKEYYLKRKCGIAINHLRASHTVVSAKKCEGGYKLRGTLTWASGYEIFDTLLIGFHYNGFEYEAMSSFLAQENFHIGSADKTFVGYGLNTVNIELKDFFVKEEEIVSYKNIGNYTKNKSVSKTVHFCLYGLGMCAVENCSDKQIAKKAFEEMESIKEQFLSTIDGNLLDTLRVQLFLLVQKIITTAMIQNGGKSILSDQTLQRLYKEIMMFNSNGLNKTLKDLFKKEFING